MSERCSDMKRNPEHTLVCFGYASLAIFFGAACGVVLRFLLWSACWYSHALFGLILRAPVRVLVMRRLLAIFVYRVGLFSVCRYGSLEVLTRAVFLFESCSFVGSRMRSSRLVRSL